uniref:Uncharacterized protein n=1 Tax=Rhizophora mucronata TaxID=61149 RepID=A0A2P2NI13_RHIMU
MLKPIGFLVFLETYIWLQISEC